MAETTWTQVAGMSSDTDVDNVEDFAEQAEASKDAAAASAAAAALSETAAETAETNAETAETNAAASAATATTKASEASTSAATATTKASEASTSASNAATSATAAQTAQTASETAQTAAETAQTAAETAETNAETAQAAAEAAKDAIDGLYLGAQASDPSVDGLGAALTAGDWYYNTTGNIVRIYDGSVWVDGSVETSTLATAAQGALADTAVQPADLSTVATSGAYADLSGLPTLGTAAATAATDYATAAQGTSADTAFGWGDHGAVGYLTSYTETDPIFSASDAAAVTSSQITNWDTAYGWGDHAAAGFVNDPNGVITVDGSSNVGIGTTNQNYRLAVKDSGVGLALINQNDTVWTVGQNVVIDEFSIRDASAGQTRLHIDSSGNVGIGTGDLTVAGIIETTGGTDINMDATASGQLKLDGNGYGGAIALNAQGMNIYTNAASRALIFGTNETERMRIDSNGRLVVANAAPTPDGYIKVPVGSSTLGAWSSISGTSSNRLHMRFENPNGVVGSINTSGSATGFNTSSDYRLKTAAQPMTGASARVQALNPVNFEWIADGTRVDGFLAHEAQEVVPEAVTGTKDAMGDEEYEVTPAVLDDDGNVVTEAVMGTRSVPEYQGIDQSKLVPLLTAALQEALTKIDALEARLTALETP